jgi:hypothetical protein
MIEDDAGFRERTREIDQFGQLRFEEPSVERKAKTMQDFEPFAKFRIQIQARFATGQRAQHAGIRVIGRAVADTAEPAMTGPDMRAQHIFNGGADSQVGGAHDSGAGT